MNASSSIFNTELRHVLGNYPKIRLAILFGSVASGTARPDSDLDVAVLADQPLDTDTRFALTGDLAGEFGRPVDLVDLRTAGEPLLGQILTGTRIMGDDAAYARLLTRHLLDVADFLPLQERILEERRRQWIGN